MQTPTTTSGASRFCGYCAHAVQAGKFVVEGIMRGERDNKSNNNKNKLQENTDEDERALESLALM
jgi:hypothetical protein